MISSMFANLFGTGILLLLMSGIWKANARRWNRLAAVYDEQLATACATGSTKHMQTVILTGGHMGYNSYKGIVTVEVTGEGILFRIMTPFSMFHSPLLVPFGDIQVAPNRWYLLGKTFQLTFAGVNDVQMIVHSETIEWIEQETHKLAVEFTNDRPNEFQAADSRPLLQPLS